MSEKCLSSKTWSSNLGSGDNVDGFCGKMTTFNVTASCGKVLIEFKSDDSITGKGFNATYEVIPHPSKWYPSTSPPLTIILYFPALCISINIFEKWSRFKVTLREEGAEEIYFELKMLQVCMTFASWILGLLSYSFLPEKFSLLGKTFHLLPDLFFFCPFSFSFYISFFLPPFLPFSIFLSQS